MKRGAKPTIAPDLKYKIATMYQSGEKVKDIAKKLHIRTTTVSNIVYRLGITRPRGNQEREGEIVRLGRLGKKNHEIAEIVNCSQSVVCTTLCKYGIRTYNKNRGRSKERSIDLPVPEIKTKEEPVKIILISGKRYVDVTDRIFDDGSNEIYYGSAMEMCL